MKNRLAKQKMVNAEDRVYVYQRMMTTEDKMALLECLCDDGEDCQCFDDIETNAKLVVRINDDTPPPPTTTTQRQQQYRCLSQLEWPASTPQQT
eukprot:Pgem_evm1s7143